MKMTDEEIEKLAEEWCFSDDKHYTLAQFGGHKISKYGSEEGFKAGYRACQEQRKWIECDRIMPVGKGWVLVRHNVGGMAIAAYNHHTNRYVLQNTTLEMGEREYSHWMPLPEAPEVEAGRDE